MKVSFVLTMVLMLIVESHSKGQEQLVATSPSQMSKDDSGTSGKIALDEIVRRQKFNGDVIVIQNELDGLVDSTGGGACPSAACLIAYQALRLIAGNEPEANPHRIAVMAFSTMPKLLKGRLTNFQVIELLNYYGAKLGDRKIDIEVLSSPNSPHATNGNTWAIDALPKFSLEKDQISIMSYTVTYPSGEVAGRHFVLIKEIDGDVIRVLDPHAPTKDYSFKVRVGQSGTGRIFLDYPPGKPSNGVVNEINTLFRITLCPRPDAQRLVPTEDTAVGPIMEKVDGLASELSAIGELKSPLSWRKRGALFGLPSLDLPSDLGGANWPTIKMIEIFRHAGRHDLNLRDVIGGAHARVLLNSKNPEVRDIVQQIADGNGYMAIAITEPNVGSDFTAMESTAKRVDGGYVLNGHKRFNARLEQASHVIVFTKSPTGNNGRISTFVLPIKTKGLEIEHLEAHGLKGNSYGGLILSDVFVPSSHLIGEEDDGRDIFNSHFRYWRLMQTATAIGTAERALEIMAERLKSRHAFGGPIGRFTHLQQPLGQHTTELRMAYALAKEAAALLDQKEYALADPLINGLKAEGIEIAINAVDAAARAFGGEGYSNLVDIGDRLQDLNGLRIADGATDVMRSSVVSSVYGKEFWQMAVEAKKQ